MSPHFRTLFALTTWLCLLTVSASLRGAEKTASLEDGFRNPPVQTKPAVYWYWISDNISKQGVTRDLEAMARVGIGEAFIGNIFLEDIPAGDVKVMTEEWWELIEHAVREGARVGVNIGMFNCPGWSQSGGPWITPDRAMRYLTSLELRVRGPKRLEVGLEIPVDDFQDVVVLAFRAPKSDADSLAGHRPRIVSTPEVNRLQAVVDGDLGTQVELPTGQFTFNIELDAPMTARSIALVPTLSPWAAECELLAGDDRGQFRSIKTFKYDRSNMKVHVGPMPEGPVVACFEPTTAKQFRIVFRQVAGQASLREIDLSAATRVESYVEKQLGKMHPTPLPTWDTYLWPEQAEVDSSELAIAADGIVDLSAKMSDDGTLRWNVPEGEWVIQRIGMAPTGTENSPSSPEGIGLEVDKMNRDHAKHHFDAFIGQLLKRMPADERKGFTTVVADSYEQGSQNWTEGFDGLFCERYGYDPKPWLATLSGRVVGSADQSNRFLWDLRRLVADRIATEYVGGLRDLCQPHGLQVWLENYGHWGFPAEFLQYGGQSHRIGGEFWTQGSLGSIECRAASSAANTYGFPIVSAEAFTSSPSRFDTVPADLKARGDWAFCEGINHFVLHVCIQQPWEDRWPGVNAWFGTEFNRHNTWFEDGRTWIDYLRRCCFLLQQGTRVADVAYFIGEDTPKMTGIRQPELPPGYDFDYINAEVLLKNARVEDGRLTLSHGASYRVLVLPDQETMRPELLEKLAELVKDGAVVVGPAPKRSPSMRGYPQCDERVKQLAAEIWGEGRSSRPGAMATTDLTTVFERLGVAADFVSETPLRYTHRSSGAKEIYFVANPEPQDVTTMAAFRVGNRAPAMWCPKSGQIERPAAYEQKGGTVRLPITLGPYGSAFVVFGSKPASPERIVTVQRDSETILDATADVRPQPSDATSEAPAGSFTVALWARPAIDTTIVPQHVAGVNGMAEPRNEATVATHGTHLGGEGHAGCGIAVGKNGVCVFEHGASYFSPPLSFATPIEDWTHVAVVYRDNRARLFLNGRLVHTGLQSKHIVHPGTASASFAGELGAIEQIGRALDAAEVADLMKSMRRPDELLPGKAVRLVMGTGGKIESLFWESGKYTFTTVSGRTDTVRVSGIPVPIEVAGPWEVVFQPPLGAAKKTTFDKLIDWTSHSDDAIRHFAGRAVYRKKFVLPESMSGKPLCLDLGKVADMASVRLNGRDLGTLWIAPWKVDISEAAEAGENVLEIEVVNTWYNRLVGDANLPEGERSTYLRGPAPISKNGSLQPAGLLGPVRIRAGVR